MITLLHVSASPREASYSRKIGCALVERLSIAKPDMRVVERDLSRLPPPHPDKDFVDASLMPEADRRSAQIRALALSEILIDELEAAHIVVISTPMHNFTVPSTLKAWIDYVVRPHRTFRNTLTGKIGLLQNRPVFIVAACGGSFEAGSTAQTDFLTPYLHYVFDTIGISNVEILRLENLNRGVAQVERALTTARDWIEKQPVTP